MPTPTNDHSVICWSLTHEPSIIAGLQIVAEQSKLFFTIPGVHFFYTDHLVSFRGIAEKENNYNGRVKVYENKTFCDTGVHYHYRNFMTSKLMFTNFSTTIT